MMVYLYNCSNIKLNIDIHPLRTENSFNFSGIVCEQICLKGVIFYEGEIYIDRENKLYIKKIKKTLQKMSFLLANINLIRPSELLTCL